MAMKSRFHNSLILASLLAASFGVLPSVLATNDSATATTSTASSPDAQVNDLKQEKIQLRRMAEAIKRTRRAGLDLIGECTQPLEMMGEIDVIGSDVIPIMPATSEGFGNQFSAPRPKYVKLHMSQLAQMIPILQDDIDHLGIPDSEKDYAAPLLQNIGSYMIDLRQHFKKLQSLTKTTDYDQVALTNEARGVDSSCKGIDSERKKLLHEEEKVEKKEQKLEDQK